MAYKIVFDNGKEKITEESIIEIANKYSDLAMIKKVTKEDTLIEYARVLKRNCNRSGEYCEDCCLKKDGDCPLTDVPFRWDV